MDHTQPKQRILISYVSYNHDLGGDPNYTGDGPTIGIAKHLKEQGLAPDKVFLLWEEYYLESKGKSREEKFSLKKQVEEVLPSAEIESVTIRFDLKTKAASDVGQVFAELGKTVAPLFRKNEGADFFVNGSTGTHAVQTVLFLLAAREPCASIVLFERDAANDKSVCLVTSVSSARQQVREMEEREADEEAEEAEREDATIDRALLKEILEIARYARDPILLLGETGTGKTACAIEIAKSRGNGEKVVKVNCATLGSLADSQLFGHLKGSFTGAINDHKGFIEEANGGVLFLDEIGTLPSDVQGKLLKVLDDGVFRKLGSEKDEKSSFFLVCGTNADLERLSDPEYASKSDPECRHFRRDLYERIRTWTFTLKPIRDRLNEVDRFVDEFLKEFNAKTPSTTGAKGFGCKVKISDEARSYLRKHIGERDLSGNFRTLRGVVRRLATRALMEAAGTGKAVISRNQVENELKKMRKAPQANSLSANEQGNDSAANAVSTALSRDALIDKIVHGVMGDECYGTTHKLKRVKLEYVVGLVLDGKDNAEIEAILFSHLTEKRRSQAIRKFFDEFGKGISLEGIRAKKKELVGEKA